MNCVLLHGAMSIEAREQTAQLFASTGGILIATAAVIANDVAFAETTDLVFYDLSHSKGSIEEISARYNQIGRQSPLTIHVLTPSNENLSNSLQLLREVLKTNNGAQIPSISNRKYEQ